MLQFLVIFSFHMKNQTMSQKNQHQNTTKLMLREFHEYFFFACDWQWLTAKNIKINCVKFSWKW